MTPPTINRRAFLGSLSAFLVLVGCKKADPKPATAPPTTTTPITNGNANPVIPPKVYDQSLYTTTELGPNLINGTDFSSTLYGYTDKLAYKRGDMLGLYYSGPANPKQVITLSDFNGKIMGYYSAPVSVQKMKTNKPWLDGCKFDKTADIKLPDNLKPGVYRFRGTNYFVISDNDNYHDITIVYPTNTDNAYNYGGGKSIYDPALPDRATVSSFARYQDGLLNRKDFTSSFFFWMMTQNYDANYITDADLDDYKNIEKTKVLMIVGHSEYWTRAARENVDKFVASGRNMLVLSGNTMYWQVRYNKPENLMICYKDNNLDPLKDSPYSTTLWDSPFLKYPIINSIGADFAGGGYGNKLENRQDGYKIVNDKSPLFEGTGLKNGDILSIPTIEYDGAPVVKMISPGSKTIPVIDNTKLNFHQIELLGYDFAANGSDAGPNVASKGLGTFIVFKKTPTSGTVVNVATTDWCNKRGIGGKDKEKVRQITKNMIDKSLSDQTLFVS
ncbi:N,N-dimethylformamidase beta subunit family domain-containing protein [Mucilaginibacter lutimaris]|uniref:N,N-dimethylformamidase beta subunit family domain-containing protein n=1 Tax=Mucilaginibacter lutimaris TaxID=931629 RepID=A0ABW2ZAJ9_9SPHI